MRAVFVLVSGAVWAGETPPPSTAPGPAGFRVRPQEIAPFALGLRLDDPRDRDPDLPLAATIVTLTWGAHQREVCRQLGLRSDPSTAEFDLHSIQAGHRDDLAIYVQVR